MSKAALMDAAWPTTTVEANTLTVQIAGLRRALDEGRTGESLIQTVRGRRWRPGANGGEHHHRPAGREMRLDGGKYGAALLPEMPTRMSLPDSATHAAAIPPPETPKA